MVRRSFVTVNESGLYALALRAKGAMTPGTEQHRFSAVGHLGDPAGDPEARVLRGSQLRPPRDR